MLLSAWRELVEDGLQLFGLDARAGVAHLDFELRGFRPAFDRLRAHGHGYEAAIREFDGVRKKIRDDLAQPQRIAHDVRRRRGVHFEVQRDAFLRGPRLIRFDAIVEHAAHVERDLLDHHAARFNLRKIQNVVQQSEQGIGAMLRGFEMIALVACERAVEHHVQHAEQAVQRECAARATYWRETRSWPD